MGDILLGVVALPLIVLDLFAGYGGFSGAFKERGHKVYTVDFEKHFNPDLCVDIMDVDVYTILRMCGTPDAVLASPPCGAFSVLSISHHWQKGEPRESARKSLDLVKHTVKLINNLQPAFWVMENPRGMLRKKFGHPVATVTYCQYGERYMKPTDLWGRLPPSFAPKKCKNRDPCHEPTPRGSQQFAGAKRPNFLMTRWQKELQRMDHKERAARMAVIPHGLSLALCEAMEKDLGTVTIDPLRVLG